MSISDEDAIININTISYGKNKLFKVTIPPIMIPDTIRAHIINNSTKVWNTKKKYIDLGLSNKEINERLKEYKRDNGIKDLFAVFIKLTDKSHSNVLSFITGHDKKDYTKDPARKTIMQKSLNEISSQFNKEVFVVSSSGTKTSKSQVSSEIVEELESEIESLKGTIGFLFNKIIELNTMMGDDNKFEMLDLEPEDEALIGELDQLILNGVEKLIAGEGIIE